MAGGVATQRTGDSGGPREPASYKPTAKETARKSYNGDAASKLSVEELLAADAGVRMRQESIEKVEEKISVDSKRAIALDALGGHTKFLFDSASNLRGNVDKSKDAFGHTRATVRTSDTREASDYISVVTDPNSPLASFDVCVRQLATANKITIGKADLALATAVHDIIGAAVAANIEPGGAGAFLAVIRGAAGDLDGDIPKNAFARDLYILAKCATEDAAIPGADADAIVASLITRADEMYEEMKISRVSAGLESLETAAVGAACLFQASEFKIYSGELGLDKIRQHIVLDAANAQGIFGATAQSVKDAAHAWQDANFVKDAEERNDRAAKFVLAAIDKAAAIDGATAHSVVDAMDLAFDQYCDSCTITLADGDSLQTVINKINRTSDRSGVIASSISNGAGNFMLQLSAKQTGELNNIKFYDAGFGEEGIEEYLDVAGGHSVYATQEGRGSVTYVGSVPRLSNYNTIKHGGAEITLHKPNSSAAARQSVSIGADLEIAVNNIKDFVKAYNELAKFQAEQTARGSNHLLKDTAILGKDRILSSVFASMQRVTSIYRPDNDDGFQSLGQLGITVEEVPEDKENGIPAHNELLINGEQLTKKLREDTANGFRNVKNLFSFSYTSTDANLAVLLHNGSWGDADLDVSVNIAGAFGPDANKQVSIIHNGVARFYNLTGNPGNYTLHITEEDSPNDPLIGLSLRYSGGDANNMLLSMKRGAADLLYRDLSSFVTDKSIGLVGVIDKTVIEIAEEATRQEKELKEKKLTLEKYEDRRSREIANSLAVSQQARLMTDFLNKWMDGLNADK